MSENSGLKRSILMKSLEQFEKENPTVDDQARTDFGVGFDYGWDECKKAMDKVLDDEINRWSPYTTEFRKGCLLSLQEFKEKLLGEKKW